MSRIGKKPVELPKGVTAEVKGQTIEVKGPKGAQTFPATDDVTIAVDTNTIAEAGGAAVVTATLANAFSLDITVDLALTGTATSGADYNATTTQIVVPAGQTTGSATITAVDDAAIEGDETVVVDAVGIIRGHRIIRVTHD